MSQPWGRREFVRIASLGPLGLGLGDYLSLRAQSKTDTDRSCIMVVLDGGMSHHDTFDMKLDAPSEIRGTFKSIPTKVPGIQVCEHLPKVAAQIDKFAILRSVWGRTAIHFNGVYFLMTGYLPIQSMEFPSLGAVVAKELGSRKGMPPYVLNAMLDHAMGPGFLGSAYAPFWVRSDPNAPDFRVDDLELPVDVDWQTVSDRRWLVKQMDDAFRDRDTKGITASRDSYYVEAERIMRSPEVKKAFDIWAEPDPLRDRYGRTPIGQGCLLARRLVESGVRFVTVNASRAIWDTHADNFNRLQKVLLPEFDMAYSALLQDLSDRGMLGSTLVVVSGEFGRTPKINATGGRDHWPRVFSVLLAGAGIKGGQLYGSSDATGAEPKDNPTSIEDLAATIYERLGVDPKKEYHAPSGRPIRLSNNGTPIRSPLV